MRTRPVRDGYEERYVGNLIGDVAGRDVADLQVGGLADALPLEGGSPPANARG
jgi:hypothetical protein